MRKAPPDTGRLLAIALAAMVSGQLVLAASSHHYAPHDDHEHACVICVFSAADQVGAPVLGEILSPLAARIPAPEAEVAPRVSGSDVVHLARGPPSLHV